ncbi:hypothetical protein [Paractinoplanes lichenicola]|uniref:Uncharacterized protein n=1 Tax=Paractinoplanes lichenicola TaxID=2802976 RepID=A0ABS1VTK3_9ACTN|nr:hypothetical protein [Actinoplanes lichenicola]MBL7257804.1 hypothetical protein [Actinoplanes lichenicola]
MRKLVQPGARAATMVALLSATMLAAFAAPSAAGAAGNDAARVGTAIDRATTAQAGAEKTLTATAESFSSTVGATQVQVPRAANRPVTITAGGAQVGLALPAGGSAGRAQQTGTGTVVYANSRSAADVAVQTLTDGAVRALVTIADSSAPAEYRFPLTLPARTHLAANPDGSLDITDGTLVYGKVAAPWATDATGAAVPTSYRLEGDTIVQTVAHGKATAYPVVADPSISFGLFVYVRFSKAEIQRMPAWAFTAGAVGFADYACNLIPNPIYKSACKGAAAGYITGFYNTFRSARSAKQCLELKYNYAPQLLVGYRRYNC